MEIIQQRLEREEDMDLVQTAPTSPTGVVKSDGETVEIHSPSEMPDPSVIEEYLEPIVAINIVVPTESSAP
jgi:GTP-binding protein LepA